MHIDEMVIIEISKHHQNIHTIKNTTPKYHLKSK